MVMLRAAARSGEWAQHFSNAFCFIKLVNITACMLIMMFPETVEALSVALEGYKNKLIQ